MRPFKTEEGGAGRAGLSRYRFEEGAFLRNGEKYVGRSMEAISKIHIHVFQKRHIISSAGCTFPSLLHATSSAGIAYVNMIAPMNRGRA